MFDQKSFGTRLLEIRTASGEKQPDLAEVLDVSVTQISEMENGKKGTTFPKLTLICEHYNVSADYLLGLTEEPKPYKRRKRV